MRVRSSGLRTEAKRPTGQRRLHWLWKRHVQIQLRCQHRRLAGGVDWSSDHARSSQDSRCGVKEKPTLYKVAGKRPIPYTETAPFSLTFMRMPSEAPFLSAAFSLRRRSSSAFMSSSDMAFPFRWHKSTARWLWTSAPSWRLRSWRRLPFSAAGQAGLMSRIGTHSPRAHDPRRSTRKSFRGWSAVSGGKRQEQIQMITTAMAAAQSAITISLSRPWADILLLHQPNEVSLSLGPTA